MSSKRKALAETDGNASAIAPPPKKIAKDLSVEEAAKEIGNKNQASRGGQNRILTPDQEVAVLEYARGQTLLGIPCSWQMIAAEVTRIRALENRAPASEGWVKAFWRKKKSELVTVTGDGGGPPTVAKARKFRYSNADTVSESTYPNYIKIAWPGRNSDADTDKEDALRSDETPAADVIKRLSKVGFPISRDGMEKFQWMLQEQRNRDPDTYDMIIYNDFAGRGITEMMENMLAEFNNILFKKDVSPFKKWAYVEGLATFLKLGQLYHWMMNCDSQGIQEIIDMFGTMILTVFGVLSEHKLLAPESPVTNVGVMAIFMIEFLNHDICRDIAWGPEVVRALDKAKVQLKLHKKVPKLDKKIEELRVLYKMKETIEHAGGMNVYKWHANERNWGPSDDWEDGERLWARWNWTKEYSEFSWLHSGGEEYNLEIWSEEKKAPLTFGTEEFKKRMKEEYDIDCDDSDSNPTPSQKRSPSPDSEEDGEDEPK